VLATILNSNFQREAMAASGVFPAYGPRATVLDETFELKPWRKSCVRIVDGDRKLDGVASGAFPDAAQQSKICNTNIHGGKNDNDRKMPRLR